MKQSILKKIPKMTFQDVVAKLVEGQVLQQQLGITDQMMQEYYDASMSYYANKEYKEASDCFLFMLALNPLQSNLWIQAAKTAYCQHEYEEALEAYSMAMFCDPDDPFPHLYAAEIYLEQNELDKAHQCREIALGLIDENPGYSSLKQIALSLKK